ncbi:MAG: T9SS type A sorting domain-containing protein [Cytophagaceae bacterium]
MGRIFTFGKSGLKTCFLCFIFCLTSYYVFAQKTTVVSATNWNTAASWNPSGVPTSGTTTTVNHPLNLDATLSISATYTFNASVTDASGGSQYTFAINTGGTLDIKANSTFEVGTTAAQVKNGGSLIIRAGDTLTVGKPGNDPDLQVMDWQNGSSVTIESGGVLVVYGKLNNSNNSTGITINGEIIVYGNVTGGNGSAMSGSGSMSATGTITTSGSGTVFGSTGDCSAGPCSGNNLCSFSNTIGSSSTICTNTSVSLTGNAVASATYQWQISTTSAGSGFSNISGATSQNYTTPNLTQTTYYRRTVTSGGCTSNSGAVTVTVVPIPTATITAESSTTFCTGGSVVLNSSTGGGYSYQWRRDGTNISGATSSSYTASVAGSYTVVVSQGSCSNTSSAVTVTVNTTPSITGTTPGARCDAGTVTLGATASAGTLNWYTASSGGSSLGTGTSFTTPSISSTTTYWVDATNSGCTSSRSSVVATVNTPPTATITPGGATTFCSGGSVTLSAGTGTGWTYQWILNGSNIGGATASTYSANASGDYQVTISATSCSPATSTVTTVTVIPSGTWLGTTADWSTASNWCGGVPTSSIDVVIPTGVSNYPVISSAANSRNITINSGASLTISGANTLTAAGNISNAGTLTSNNGSISVAGNFSNTGTFNSNTSTYTFNGGSAQSISGANIFYNLIINNASGVNITSGAGNTQSITNVLTLTSGALTTNGNLVIVSNASTHGQIAGTGTGSLAGNVTLQRYISSKGYHYITSPLSGQTVASWHDNYTMFTGPSYFNYWWYDETNHGSKYQDLSGWKAITSTATALNVMQGYAVSFSYAPLTLDVVGTYSHGSIPSNRTLSRTVNPPTHPAGNGIDGWHIVGNPFPSTIDWDAASGWTKTNIYNAAYFWDPVGNRYSTYVNGVGVNGGSRYIPAWQGFYVRVDTTTASGTFGMTNAVRVTNQNPALWRTRPLDNIVKLRITNNVVSDEIAVRFMEEATRGFDGEYDAYKMANSGNCPDMIIRYNSTDYAVNTLPLEFTEEVINLRTVVKANGTYRIEVRDFKFDPGIEVYLYDKFTDQTVDLAVINNYSVLMSRTDPADRFQLLFRKADNSNNNGGVDNGGGNSGVITGNNGVSLSENIIISGNRSGFSVKFVNFKSNTASVFIHNTLGEKIYSNESVNTANAFSDSFSSIPAGIYYVEVVTEGKKYTKKVFLGE